MATTCRYRRRLLQTSSMMLLSVRHISSWSTKQSASWVFCHRAVSSYSSVADKSSLGHLATSSPGMDPSQNRFHAPIVYHENYSFDNWPPTHTFPMDKFRHLLEAVLTTCKKTIPCHPLPRPLVRQKQDLFRTLDRNDIPLETWFAEPSGPICRDFLKRFCQAELTLEEKRYIGFREQLDRPELIERTILEVAGTILTSQLALQWGIASNLAGGTHHAHRTMGAGYTILNDLAIAANFLLKSMPSTDETNSTRVDRILVIDCDVHQGDGTAKFGDMGGKFFTLSIHCASNYPTLKANSTFDVGVQDGMKDDEYIQVLQENVELALEQVKPDFVLYDAGVDIYQHDKLGRLDVTEEGIRRRDRYVLERCVQANIPVAAVIGGGYDKDVHALARRHAIVHEECAYVWRKYKLWNRGTMTRE